MGRRECGDSVQLYSVTINQGRWSLYSIFQNNSSSKGAIKGNMPYNKINIICFVHLKLTVIVRKSQSGGK